MEIVLVDAYLAIAEIIVRLHLAPMQPMVNNALMEEDL